MQLKQGSSWLITVASFALIATPLASAASTTTITMTGVTGPYMDYVYTGPYFGTVGGSLNVPIICDDFFDDTYFDESWTAYSTSLSSIPSVGSIDPPQFSEGVVGGTVLDQSQAYTVAAYIATELLNTNQTTQAGQTVAGELSFAMWGLFSPATFTDQTNGPGGSCTLSYGCLTPGELSAAETDLTNALNQVRTLGLNPTNFDSIMNVGGVTIYTYDPSAGSPTCPGTTCPPPPQEFISVTAMPEPASVAMLALDLAAFAGLTLLLRRRFSKR